MLDEENKNMHANTSWSPKTTWNFRISYVDPHGMHLMSAQPQESYQTQKEAGENFLGMKG